MRVQVSAGRRQAGTRLLRISPVSLKQIRGRSSLRGPGLFFSDGAQSNGEILRPHWRAFAPPAISIVALIGPLQVAGRFAILMLWRDSSTRTLGRAIFGVLPVSLLALIYSSGLGGALLFAMLYGVCNGIVTILRGTAAAEFLGRDGFGAINGALTTPAALTRAAGPAIAGVLWLRTENYSLVLWVLFGSAVLSAVAFWWASSDGRRRCPRFGAPCPTGEGVDG